MNTYRQNGFTIVEVMLFLAVSGVLIAALLGGWTVLINTQRYKDSADTVYGYLQDQYNLVYNVENERTNALTCTSGAEVQVAPGGAADNRGQSECVLLGRYIQLANGTDFTSYAVVGVEPATSVTGSDRDIINSYQPNVVTQSIGLTSTTQIVPWGAVLNSKGATASPHNLAIMLLRSPQSGVVYTYIANHSPASNPVIDLSNPDAEEREVTFCVEPGAAVSGGNQSVVLRAHASSRNAVETIGDNRSC